MRDSGTVLNWSLNGPIVDKHSTGGIGDNVSLILAPALAACGAFVPMISGRGLGHTGGTLDKFDAIKGYQTQPSQQLFETVTADVGCAIIGQTAEIAPADKRLYGIRDVTATVESIDLICASILSKKLAAGLDALVLDVKVGSGAFMSKMNDAQKLAKSLCEVANGAACKEKFGHALQSGEAAERFGKMVAALGGPADFIETFETHLDHAPIIHEVLPPHSGFVTEIDAKALGLAVVELGGGRLQTTDKIDYSVGLDWILGLGLSADQETPLCRIHARTQDEADRAEARIHAAYKISQTPNDENGLIKERISI